MREEGREGGGGKERRREHGRETERERVRVTHTNTHQTALTIFFRSARAAFTGKLCFTYHVL